MYEDDEDADETIDGKVDGAGEEEDATIVLAPVVEVAPAAESVPEQEPQGVVEEPSQGGVEGIEVTQEVEGILVRFLVLSWSASYARLCASPV